MFEFLRLCSINYTVYLWRLVLWTPIGHRCLGCKTSLNSDNKSNHHSVSPITTRCWLWCLSISDESVLFTHFQPEQKRRGPAGTQPGIPANRHTTCSVQPTANCAKTTSGAGVPWKRLHSFLSLPRLVRPWRTRAQRANQPTSVGDGSS